MDEEFFLNHYLKPSEDRLDPNFIHPLPPVEGLKNRGKFIIQAELDDTFSTNIIYKYESEPAGIKLIDVYKCTQNLNKGQFIRLVGTLSIVKAGYPILFLDAAVSNISPMTQEREETTTRVLIHMPQADLNQRGRVYSQLSKTAERLHLACKEMLNPKMPDFWGPVWFAETKKFEMEIIKALRNSACESYMNLVENTGEDTTLDYQPVKEHVVFTTSKNEHLLFEKLGLSVPVEAQAAFFSVLASGAENP